MADGNDIMSREAYVYLYGPFSGAAYGHNLTLAFRCGLRNEAWMALSMRIQDTLHAGERYYISSHRDAITVVAPVANHYFLILWNNGVPDLQKAYVDIYAWYYAQRLANFPNTPACSDVAKKILEAWNGQDERRIGVPDTNGHGDNGRCPKCGSPAYVGLLAVECSAGAKCGESKPGPEVERLLGGGAGLFREPAFRVKGSVFNPICATPEAAVAAYKRRTGGL